MARSPTSIRNKLAASTSPLTAPAPDNAANGGWQPKFTLDLNVASAKAFRAVEENFAEWRKTQPAELKLADGWHEFTPQMCEKALLLNAGNRQVSFSTVQYYARQMAKGDWMETGQPAIFDVHGKTADMQHRAWAGYLGGHNFTTYVVNQRKEIPNGFAYIDNIKARSLQDALYTAGLNGLSGVLAQTVKLAWLHECEALTASTEVHQPVKLAPREGIVFVHTHPELRQATRLMAADHSDAAEVFIYRDVASYLAYLIVKHHDEFTLDEFMEAMAVENTEDGNPIAAFQDLMQKDRMNKQRRTKSKVQPFKRHQVLGHAIMCFNAWKRQEEIIGKFIMPPNEPFPVIEGGEQEQEQQEAAE